MVMGPTNVSALQQQSTAPKNLTTETVSQQDFLQLLVAQLQNQDPLNPMENQEFVAELATFSQLEQATNQTALLEQLVNSQSSNTTSQALSLIGKEAASENSTFLFEPGKTVDFMFQAPGEGSYTVQAVDQNGQVVFTDTVSAGGPGEQSYTFDGTTADGQTLRSGVYAVQIGSVVDGSGEQSGLPTYMRGTVEGVNFVDGTPVLMINGQPVSMGAVRAVYEPEA